MRGRTLLLGLIAAAAAGMPARAEIINLSCDDGGMLLTIDTDRGTVTDKNPFQQTNMVAPLIVTNETFAWSEGSGDTAADYRMDRATRRVSARAQGAEVSLSNPQCGRSAVLLPKF